MSFRRRASPPDRGPDAAAAARRRRGSLSPGGCRLSDALVPARLIVIGFDDCGDGRFVYEHAVVLYPHEGRSDYVEHRDVLVAGYRRVAALGDEVERELPTS